MSATHTVDGFGTASGNWTGHRGRQGPELPDPRRALCDEDQRMVFGADTYRTFVGLHATMPEEPEPWERRMLDRPATVVSRTLDGHIQELVHRPTPHV